MQKLVTSIQSHRSREDECTANSKNTVRPTQTRNTSNKDATLKRKNLEEADCLKIRLANCTFCSYVTTINHQQGTNLFSLISR